MDTQSDHDRRPTRSRESDRASTGVVPDGAKRALSALLGGVLLVRGLRRRSLRGMAMALLGGWVLSRALGTNARIERELESRTPLGRESGDRTADEPSVSRTVTVGRPADELFDTWRDPDQFSRIMGHFADVTSADGDRYYWTLHGPRGRDVSWETHVVEEVPGERLRWESPADAMVPNEGSVRFDPAPGDRGTQVTLSVSFDPPGGALGDAALRRLDIVPKAVVGEALRRFKSLAETGDIQTLEDNSSGRGRGDLV